MKKVEIKIPDLGGDGEATVVEILAQVGGQLRADEPLVAVETDKATSEIPAAMAGKLVQLYVQLNAKVRSGDLLALIEVEGQAEASAAAQVAAPAALAPAAAEPQPVAVAAQAPQATQGAAEAKEALVEVLLPELGGDDGTVVELLVQVGAAVTAQQSILAVETAKATAEVPTPCAGVVAELAVKLGQKVGTGALLARIRTTASQASPQPAGGAAIVPPSPAVAPVATPAPVASGAAPLAPAATLPPQLAAAALAPALSGGAAQVVTAGLPLGSQFHASPAVRKLARDLGADLQRVTASGPSGRVTVEDVKQYIKGVLQQQREGGSGAAATGPKTVLPDFSRFGAVEEQKLSGIKRVTGEHLSNSWRTVPLVTHAEECDISELEQFRKQLNARTEEGLPKTTPLAFIIKAVVKALQKYPTFNSSFDPNGPKLILKKYYHIGVAVETPKGLVVPVLRNANSLTLDQISSLLKELSAKARAGKLAREDMEGGSFSVSSLGGLGGVHFTPLVNLPETAILGVSRSSMRPVWNGESFVPRLILPFSLSYDHRVIDGAEAARFCSYLSQILSDLRYLLV